MNLLLDLFLTFARIGLFTFGGGYAMIAMMEDACVEKKKWLTHDEMMNVTVIAESTPGPIAINCATYTGYRQAGLAGAVIATLGIVTPSFLLIWLISGILEHFLALPLVAAAFKGIRVAVGLLILDAAVTMIRKMHKKPIPRAIMVCSAALMLAVELFDLPVSSITLMVAAALVSLGIFSYQKPKKGGAAK